MSLMTSPSGKKKEGYAMHFPPFCYTRKSENNAVLED